MREETAHVTSLEREIRTLRDELKIARSSPRPLFGGGEVSPRTNTRISKLQAAVRGYMQRLKLHRTRVHHAALSAGVLFAMKNTVQGVFYCLYSCITLLTSCAFYLLF